MLSRTKNWRIARALAFAATFAVIVFVTFSVGGGWKREWTRQQDEDAGWKRAQHLKKMKEEANQSAPATNLCRMTEA